MRYSLPFALATNAGGRSRATRAHKQWKELRVNSSDDKSPNVLVAGSLAFDYIMDFPGHFKDHILPDKLHCINISFLVDKLKQQRGGCAANIAYTLALLGERPRILAAAGRDFGQYSAWLQEQGVDVGSILRVDDEVTATCFITTDKADNQITGFYVGAMPRAKEISLKANSGPHFRYAVVAPDDPDAMLRHCREAREAGVKLIYDPSFQVTAMDGPRLWEGAQGAYALILNDYEFAVFCEKTGKDANSILEHIELLVVTLGEKGSQVYRKGQDVLDIPPAKVADVVDPTGAGDAFRGGFVAGLLRGLPLEACGRMGSVASAYAVERYGTQNHSYSQQDFADRYSQNFGMVPEGVLIA